MCRDKVTKRSPAVNELKDFLNARSRMIIPIPDTDSCSDAKEMVDDLKVVFITLFAEARVKPLDKNSIPIIATVVVHFHNIITILCGA